MSTAATVEVVWTGHCRHCDTEWDILDEQLRATYPQVGEASFAADAMIVDCSCSQDVDLTRMEIKTFPFAAFDVLPPAAGCPECGVEHEPDLPHDMGSLVYLYRFRSREAKAGREERWPTWIDAMAHCTPATRALWIAEMAKLGHILHEDGSVTIVDD